MPEVGRSSKGKSIANLVHMAEGEKIAALLRVQEFPEEEGQRFIVMGTRKGTIKKTDLERVLEPALGRHHRDSDRRRRSADRRGGDRRHEGPRHRHRATAWRSGSRRPTRGRWAARAYGVRGMQLREGDEVVAMEVVSDDSTLLTVCENGYGKRTEVSEYRRQTRGGIGLKNVQTSDRNGLVVGIACVTDRDELLLVTEQGQIIRMKAGDLRPIGRDTQGVRLMDLAEGDRLVSIATLTEPRSQSRSRRTAEGQGRAQSRRRTQER